LKAFKLDIPDTVKELYKKRLDRIKKEKLFFVAEEKVENFKNSNYSCFGRVLHIRKFKDYAIAIFLVNTKKTTLILKGEIRDLFLKNVRRNDYLYIVGKKEKNTDITVLFFRIVSISINLQSKIKNFLHQRLLKNEKNSLILAEYSKTYQLIHNIFNKAGYIQIKSKILQNSFYGGDSRPFKTYSNNSHKYKYLKFSSEPILKEAIVGGIEKVYDFGIVFRNESDSSTRGEEIKALEFCSANEELKDFRKILLKFIKKTLKLKKVYREDYNDICNIKGSLLSYKNFKSKIVPKIIKPTFVYNLPSGTSPFIACSDKDQAIAKRELLIINGMTIAEIYQNERDPFKQIAFLEKQFSKRRDYKIDYSSYIHSQLLGSPIINVCFVSIDRLLSLLTNQKDLRSML
jgi:lysyl-tRNA synthetase class II